MDKLLKQALEEYKKRGINLENPSILKTGKEAVVYTVYEDPDIIGTGRKKLALKIYKPEDERGFHKTHEYLAGKFHRIKSIRRAIDAKNKFSKQYLQKGWVKREFFFLDRLTSLGADIPQVHEQTANSILMDNIGEEEPAPRLMDLDLSVEEAKQAFGDVLKNIKLFLEVGFVHGDLSAYNILYWQGKIYIIDFPQAVDIRSNPNKDALLKRDLDNVINYFQKNLEIEKQKIYQEFGLYE